MALETLIQAQRIAAAEMEIDYGLIEELQEPRLHFLGNITVAESGLVIPSYRAHSGPEGRDFIWKGGIREAAYDSIEKGELVAKELAVEMFSKLAARGLTHPSSGHPYVYGGAKALIMADVHKLSPEQNKQVMREFQMRMENAGFCNAFVDVAAGDVGVDSGRLDVYAQNNIDRHPEDKYNLAVITGKSPEMGGLEFRSAATGWGVYVSHQVAQEYRQLQHGSVALQGFGNVGAWYAHFASNDPEQRFQLQAISDIDGTLVTSHPNGMFITEEMVRLIGEDPTMINKMHRLRDMIYRHQPDAEMKILPNTYIMQHAADWFVPAAMGNVIREENVGKMKIKHGVIEAANGPTKPHAASLLMKSGLVVVPDFIANALGVDCSVEEHVANIRVADGRGKTPTTYQVKKRLTKRQEQSTRRMFETADHIGTKNYRVAGAMLGMQAMLE